MLKQASGFQERHELAHSEPAHDHGGQNAAYPRAVNAAGLPALSIPAPVPAGAMPVGLQLVGPPGGDEMLLILAAAYEAASPWPQLAIPFLNNGAI